MARSIWSGTLSFGLVNISITLHPATKSKNLHFHLLNKEDKHPVSYQKLDAAEGKALSAEDIVKGYELEKGSYVVMEEKDFQAAEIKTGRSIDVLDFFSAEEVDPIYFQKTYYLAPTGVSAKAYHLLVKVLREENKAAAVRFVLRNKQNLGLLRVIEPALALHTMFYADEIVQAKQLLKEPEFTINPEELELARLLVSKLSGTFKAEKYKDEYRRNLEKIIKEKIEGKEVAVPKAVEKRPVIDIMSALKESVEKAKKKAA